MVAPNGDVSELPEDDSSQTIQETAVEQAAVSSVIGDLLRSRGYDVDEELDDDALIGHFESLSQRAAAIPEDLDEIQQYAELGRTYAPYQSQIEELRKAAEKQVAPQYQAQPTQSPQRQPEPQSQKRGFDEETISLAKQRCQWDAKSGQYVPKHVMDAESARILNDYAARAQRTMERFGADPEGYLQSQFSPYMQSEIQRQVEERLKDVMPAINEWQQYRDAQTHQAFLAPRDSEYVTRDEQGNFTGVTAKGSVFKQAYEQAPQELNLNQKLQWAAAQADAWELSQQKNPTPAKSGFAFAKKQPPKQPVPKTEAQQFQATKEEKRKKFVDDGRIRDEQGRFSAPDRSATIQETARKGSRPERGKSFAEMYREEKEAASV